MFLESFVLLNFHIHTVVDMLSFNTFTDIGIEILFRAKNSIKIPVLTFVKLKNRK